MNPRTIAAAAAATLLHGNGLFTAAYPYSNYPYKPYYDDRHYAKDHHAQITEAAAKAYDKCDEELWIAENRSACPHCERVKGVCDCIGYIHGGCSVCREPECNCIIWCDICKWQEKSYRRPEHKCKCKELAKAGRMWIHELDKYQNEWPEPHTIPCLDENDQPYLVRNKAGDLILKDGKPQIVTCSLTGGFFSGSKEYKPIVADSLVDWIPPSMPAVKVAPWLAVISQCTLYKKQHPEEIPSLSLRVPEARVEEPVLQQVLEQVVYNPKALAAKAAVMELFHSDEKCDCNYCCGHGGYAEFGGLSQCGRIEYPYHGWPNRPLFDDRPFAQRNPLYKKIQSIAMQAWDKCIE
jgi:hypothetical protein